MATACAYVRGPHLKIIEAKFHLLRRLIRQTEMKSLTLLTK